MATLFPGMRVPSAITNMFEDIRDAALKGSVLGSMSVSYQTTNAVAGAFLFPGDDKSIKSEAELVTVLVKKVAAVANLQTLRIEALTPFDFRLKYVYSIATFLLALLTRSPRALPTWFSGLSSLQDLRLIHHRLNKLAPEELVKGLTKLTTLELSASSVEALPDCLGAPQLLIVRAKSSL